MAEMVLVNPAIMRQGTIYKKLEEVRIREPLGILALASYLDNEGYDVEIIDTVPYYEVGDETYLGILKRELDDAICVGMSVMTAQVEHALFITKFVKNFDPDIPVIWGGVHPTLFPAQTSKDPFVDFVVYGEGEQSLLELIKELEKGGNRFESIKGIAYDGKVTPPREFLDVNKLPFLNHDLLDLRFYLERPVPIIFPGHKKFRKLIMLSSRGCPYRCTFCINKVLKTKWRAQTPDRFLDEMTFIVDRYNLDLIRTLDENFFVSKKRVEDIIKKMKERKMDIDWGSNIRANYFRENYITTDFAKKLNGVGFKFATMGAESGSDRVLRFIKKDITTTDLLNSAKVCNESGIIPVYSWMIALPGETKEEMISNISLMKKINEICPSARHYDNFVFRPYPGGELYEECKKMGLYEPASLREWADSSLNTGYRHIDELTWIEDAEFVRFLSENSQYLAYGLKEIRGFSMSNMRALYSIIPKVRWALKFFKYQDEERHLLEMFQKYVLSG